MAKIEPYVVIDGFKTWAKSGFKPIADGFDDLPYNTLVMVRYAKDTHGSAVARGWRPKMDIPRRTYIRVRRNGAYFVETHYSRLIGYKVKPYATSE